MEDLKKRIIRIIQNLVDDQRIILRDWIDNRHEPKPLSSKGGIIKENHKEKRRND